MEHSISLTRAELQDQLDQTSELCRSLTEALRKSEEEKGGLLAAAKIGLEVVEKAALDVNYTSGDSALIIRSAIAKVEKKP